MTQAKMVDLDAVEALANAATPGPWFDMGDIDVYVGEVRCAEPYTAVCRDPELDDRPGDRAFIAASRTLVPEMAAEIRALRAREAGVVAERDALRADLEEIHLWLSVGCMPAESYRPGNEAVLKRVDAQLAEMRREAEELRLTLANERGEGEPPREGWRVSLRSHRVRWFLFNERPGRVLDVQQHLSEDRQRLEWHWWDREIDRDGEVVATRAEGIESTARAAMRAASAAGGSDA